MRTKRISRGAAPAWAARLCLVVMTVAQLAAGATPARSASPQNTAAAEQRPARPSDHGRRPVDRETGEFFREPTARDDLDQRLPVEIMPEAAGAEAVAASLELREPAFDVLFDNGSLVDCDRCGSGGAGESQLRDRTAGRRTLGFGHQRAAGGRIAEDFTVDDPDGWTLRDVRLFAYQTGSGSRSTITAVDLKIWDGPPGIRGSDVVWDGGEAHRLTDSRWTGLYRVSESSSGTTNRPIMDNRVAVNATLAPGTYWLDWQTTGRLASGPWAPSLPGPGNALQSLDGGATWQPAVDPGSGETVGFPFVIEGTTGMESTGPAIHFQVTAGPNCAQDEVVVAAGTEVCYGYSMFNIGDTILTLHDLVDDQLGVLLSASTGVIQPGQAAGHHELVTINVTTTNTATWTAYNAGPTDQATGEDSATVFVATAQPLWCNGGWVGFEAGLPSDWAVANSIAGSPVYWTTVAGCGEADNYAYGGGAACASSDLQGGGSGLFDTSLVTRLNLSGTSQAELTFAVNYQNYLAQDRLDVDISSDRGASWTRLASFNDDLGPFRSYGFEQISLDLTPWSGEPELLLRWRYYDLDTSLPQDDWYVQIDDVRLTCEYRAGVFRECRYPNLAIPEFPSLGVFDTIVVDPALGTLHDLDLLLRTDHDFVGDLTAYLIVLQAAGQTSQLLFDRPGAPFGAPPGAGCSGDDIYAVIDDEGTDGAIDTTCQPSPPTLSGSLVGDQPLSHFDGLNAGGQWVLNVADNATAVTGTLEEWCLIGTACGRTLSHRVLDYPDTIEDCGTLTLGPFLYVRPSFDRLTLRAATAVRFVDGVTIRGDLAVDVDPSLAPP